MLLPLAALAGSLRAGYHGHFPPGWNVSHNPLPLSQAPRSPPHPPIVARGAAGLALVDGGHAAAPALATVRIAPPAAAAATVAQVGCAAFRARRP